MKRRNFWLILTSFPKLLVLPQNDPRGMLVACIQKIICSLVFSVNWIWNLQKMCKHFLSLPKKDMKFHDKLKWCLSFYHGYQFWKCIKNVHLNMITNTIMYEMFRWWLGILTEILWLLVLLPKMNQMHNDMIKQLCIFKTLIKLFYLTAEQ